MVGRNSIDREPPRAGRILARTHRTVKRNRHACHVVTSNPGATNPGPRQKDIEPRMQRGSTRISYGDPRSQRTNGSGDHCPIQLVDQLQRSYRQSLFVEHDLGEPSGSTVDVVRRAGYPWPEQMDRKMLRNVEKRGVHAARNDPSADGKYWQRLELGIHGLKSWDRNWQRKVRETRNSGGLQGHEASRPLRSPPSAFPGLSSRHPRVSRRSANQVLPASGLVDDACFPVIRRRLLMAAQGMGAEGTTHFPAPGKRGSPQRPTTSRVLSSRCEPGSGRGRPRHDLEV